MDKKYRQPTKSLSFGLMYGIGPKRLADDLKIEIRKASALMKRYFQVFPMIKICMDKLMKDGKENKYAVSPLDGRRRDLSSGDWDNPGVVNHYMNICKNIPFQGAGASVTKHAGCLIRRSILKNEWDAKIVNIIHDEIIVEAHVSVVTLVAKAVRKDMMKAFAIYAPGIPMEVNPEISKHWVH